MESTIRGCYLLTYWQQKNYQLVGMKLKKLAYYLKLAASSVYGVPYCMDAIRGHQPY